MTPQGSGSVGSIMARPSMRRRARCHQPETLARLAQAVGGLLARLPRDEDRSEP